MNLATGLVDRNALTEVHTVLLVLVLVAFGSEEDVERHDHARHREARREKIEP